ncbi:peptide-methionine (S)-S-oxide reductase [Flavobacterium sp. XS2P39]|uniref:peptide-methionine (S)-S-oxide reductase n=1 Tax=Flavobacterium sp. XS2P39 TaxID=3401725 RepID=UPI003AB04246
MNKIGFGGGCHWCTEAIFQAFHGVDRVEQGWIASVAPDDAFSEAVVVHFNEEITLDTLIEVHLLTHSSSSAHSMREKYRSAVYYFDGGDNETIKRRILQLSSQNNLTYITRSLVFSRFRKNTENQLNYYLKNKEAPFCQTYISPKLALIRKKFGGQAHGDF